jgi:hypothetical protein
LTNCAAMGGRPETVTVTSGTFNSCAVSLDRGGMIWIADVTFGFVKEDFIDAEGNRTMVESLSFQNGK